MTLVIDASMALAWIYAREKPPEAECADRVLQATIERATLVPSLWHTELANTLLVGERRKIITQARMMDYLARLERLPISVDDATPAARRDQVMGLAREYELSAYDATYLDLALRTAAVLATFDRKLADAMQRAGGAVFI